jgi:mitogen-activated protein kinase 7
LAASSPEDYIAAKHGDGVAVHEGHTRARTSSMMSGRLLRSLSTISVHEVADNPTELVSKGAIGKYIGAVSASDAPPSELPKEFALDG